MWHVFVFIAHSFAFPRHDMPELRIYSPPSEEGGRREAGRPMRPITACAMVEVERTRVSQVTPDSPGTPRAMVLRLISCSPRQPGFLATVARESCLSRT